MDDKKQVKVVYVKFTPFDSNHEFLSDWDEIKVGDFVVGKAGLGDSVGRVVAVKSYAANDEYIQGCDKLTRKATNNETYDGEEVFNLKHTVAREKVFIKGDGTKVVKKVDDEEAFASDGASSESLMSIVRVVGIGIGIIAFMLYKEQVFELLGL